jgi:hypothetical protein
MYQERRSRQSGSLADFDQSRRTSIQRRMANTILDMAAADYERWYIMAHSLGSVIAFKALMYDGKGFARLLTANRWKDDKFPFRAEKKSENRTPANQGYPDEPKKPMWLEDEGAVDLDKVYAKLRGLITYGSPLETFARTWPAIVQINKDARVSKDFEWLNLHDPVDIVASRLVSFGEASSTGRGEIKPKNILCRASQWVTHAHTSYLATKFRNVDRRILPALLEWMIDGNKTLDSKADSMSRRILPRSGIAGHRMLAILQWILALLIGCLIWPYAASAVVGAVRGIASAATFFLPDILDTINRAHKWVVDNVLTPLFPGIDPIEDAVRIGKLLGVAGIVLAVFGAAHFAIDWWLDRDDRDLSPGADAKTINRMRSIERPSINVEGLR